MRSVKRKRSGRAPSKGRDKVAPSVTDRVRAFVGSRPESRVERKLYAQVAATLGREIVGGLHKPGETLPGVQEMCVRFRVSRTALREAYSILSAKGLIEAKPKVGTRVRPAFDWNALDPDIVAWHFQSAPTEKKVEDLFTLRRMIEPAAARLAAAARSPETLKRLEDSYARMELYRNGDGDLIAADLDFHMSILEGLGNPFLSTLGGLIHTTLRAVFAFSWEGAARIQDERLRGHKVILTAIKAGQPEQAEKLMSSLLEDSLADVRSVLRKL